MSWGFVCLLLYLQTNYEICFYSANKIDNMNENFDLLTLKEGYEEASGISTPSKEIQPEENAFDASSNPYVKAGKNKVAYVVRIVFAIEGLKW